MARLKKVAKEKEHEHVVIDGVQYVRAGQLVEAKRLDGMEYCIVRASDAGVFYGYVENDDSRRVVMHNVRRVWRWEGANTLSQLAVDGVPIGVKGLEIKVAVEVPKIILYTVTEVIPCTEKARMSLAAIPEWRYEA